jgi:hypothetical protein
MNSHLVRLDATFNRIEGTMNIVASAEFSKKCGKSRVHYKGQVSLQAV